MKWDGSKGGGQDCWNQKRRGGWWHKLMVGRLVSVLVDGSIGYVLKMSDAPDRFRKEKQKEMGGRRTNS